VRCLILHAFIGAGCVATHDRKADSAVVFWGVDSVWFVADGSLPPELAGWAFASEDPARRERRDVRVTSPQGASALLRRWYKRKVHFALLPLDVDFFTEEKFGPGYQVALGQVSAITTSVAREKDGTYFAVFAHPARFHEVSSMLSSAGYRDDTAHFLDSLVEPLLRFEAFCKKYGSREATEGTR
jgi:hypothetical protein